eukprot:scaffold15568_cov95-Cylindrotheca_fusiformis.AAC.2
MTFIIGNIPKFAHWLFKKNKAPTKPTIHWKDYPPERIRSVQHVSERQKISSTHRKTVPVGYTIEDNGWTERNLCFESDHKESLFWRSAFHEGATYEGKQSSFVG